jgi:hypothetical protein
MTPVAALPVAAPVRVRDRLRDTPDGPVPVVHRGLHALYVDVGGWCVGVVSRAAAQVPCALRAATEPLPEYLSGTPISAYVSGGTLHVGSRPLSIGRLEGTYVPRLGHDGVLGTEACSVTVQATPPATVAELAAELTGGRIDPAAAARLIGRGEGLTPLGDDILAGWVALHRAAGVPTPDVDDVVRTHAHRTTVLSATLLECAVHGEVLPEFAAWVRAIGTADEPRAAATLSAVGATSGAGLLHGAGLALAAISALQEAA